MLASFVVGALLGLAHVRLFTGSIESLLARPDVTGRVKALALMGAAFRYLMTFLAGICVIRIASLDPVALGAGLIVAVTVYRAVLIAKVTKT